MSSIAYNAQLPLEVRVRSGSLGDVTVRGRVRFPDGRTVDFAHADDLSMMPDAQHDYTLPPGLPHGTLLQLAFLIGDNPGNPYRIEVALSQGGQLSAPPFQSQGGTNADGAAAVRFDVSLA
jgi:hypothetical protein